MSLYGIGETYHGGFSTYNGSGVLTAADSTPVGVLVVNGTDTGATVTITTATTGDYKIAAALAGRTVGDDCYVRYSATVGGLTQRNYTVPFRIAFAAALTSPVSTASVTLETLTVTAITSTVRFTATGAADTAVDAFSPRAATATTPIGYRVLRWLTGPNAGEDSVVLIDRGSGDYEVTMAPKGGTIAIGNTALAV